MGTEITFQNEMLIVALTESSSEVLLRFRGKSVDRDPGAFLTPVLQDSKTKAGARRMVLDFTELAYMNSSSVTPVIKLLNEIKEGTHSIQVLYSKNKKWQELSFSALKVFQTRDGRVEVRGQ